MAPFDAAGVVSGTLAPGRKKQNAMKKRQTSLDPGSQSRAAVLAA
jgi:hypothetical protein